MTPRINRTSVRTHRNAGPASWFDPGAAAQPLARPLTSRRLMFVTAERLVQIWLSNKQEFVELRALRLRMERAKAYLALPGCNEELGKAYLEVLAKKHRKHLEHLRINRQQALKMIALLDGELGTTHKCDARARSWA